MRSHIENIQVDGKPVDVTLDGLLVGDISRDMDRVASVMAYWATVWAAAEQEKIKSDSAYRAWRATFARRILDGDPKLAEWKVKAAIEASPKFNAFKHALATATRNVVLSRGQFESYRVKASVLQSRGAMLRAEGERTDQVTKTRERTAETQSERGRARDDVRKLNLRKPKA